MKCLRLFTVRKISERPPGTGRHPDLRTLGEEDAEEDRGRQMFLVEDGMEDREP